MKDKYKIIITEDEAPIRRNIKSKIEECGLSFSVVESFRNGRQALEWLGCETNTADILLTDIKMPGMDGLELAKSISESYPDLMVVIISGYNNFEYAREAMKYRVTDFLTKPVDIDELRSLLSELEKRLDQTNPDLNEEAEEIVKSRNSSSLADTITGYVEEHFKEQISVTTIAEEFDCSQEFINKLIKKNRGMTLSKYIIHVRISEAKKIIRTYDDIDMQSVGELVGYNDPYYFSRIFKKYTSMSPTQYRKEYLK